MSKYHMISGGDGGYNEPVYADSWGDIVCKADVDRETIVELWKQILAEANNPNVCPRCKAMNNKAVVCPYCGYKR